MPPPVQGYPMIPPPLKTPIQGAPSRSQNHNHFEQEDGRHHGPDAGTHDVGSDPRGCALAPPAVPPRVGSHDPLCRHLLGTFR